MSAIPSPTPAPTALPITISSAVPTELNASGGGAPAATLQQGAAFAWQEFIALNWPAVQQTGTLNTRDTPDKNCLFGDPKCSGPLVWQTFRGKVEIFPGTGNPPGYPGVTSTDPSLGYDALPSYNYAFNVPACDSPAPSGTAWINLDETDQISLDSMFAGVAPTQSTGNSSPQLIRFLAKANRTEYVYVAQNKWWAAIDSKVRTNTQNYLQSKQASPPPGSSKYVSLRNGTIETKAGWRVLTPKELASGRFTTATARYYESQNGQLCYRQGTFGLVSLHIIQKTPTAPYFIYATFEQADNILTSSGTSVEDENGAINQPLPPCRSDETAPCPTTPAVTLQDTQTVSSGGLPPQVNLVPATAKYCTASTSNPPTNQLYYLNSSLQSALPRAGFICINYRDNPIPQPIIAANQAAHAAINAYNQAKKITSPWLYYKLVNVQYQAIDKNYAGFYTGNDPNSGHNPSSYHLANIVVETNRPLQLFSGGLLGTGSNSDYDSQFNSGATGIHKNMYYGGTQLNMGGCLGCHGSQGQHQEGDFSVILARGKVRLPEPPASVTGEGASVVPRNRSLVYR